MSRHTAFRRIGGDRTVLPKHVPLLPLKTLQEEKESVIADYAREELLAMPKDLPQDTRECSGRCSDLNTVKTKFYGAEEGLASKSGCRVCPKGFLDVHGQCKQ